MEPNRRTGGAARGLLRRHASWFLVAAAYLVVSPYFERLNNPNENVRVWATRAIVAHHVLNIDDVSREWGYVNDKAKNERHVYSSKAPGVSFLGVPVLAAETGLRSLFGWPPPGKRATTFWLRLVAVKLPMLAFFWLFARWVERRTGSALARDLLLVGLGLGTMLYPYGGMFVGHALAAAAAFAAFILIDDPRVDAPGPADARAVALRAAGAGLLAGLAVALEYQVILVAAALAVYVAVRRWRALLPFAAGALPVAAALGAYHAALFGRPWTFPYAHIENPYFAATAHRAGFHGLALPDWGALPVILFSPAYGLFAFSPVLLLGLAGAIFLAARGPRREAVLVLAVALSMFLFNAGMSNWRAGWCAGPRYIASTVPFLLLPIVQLWPRLGRRAWLTAALVGLTIASVVLNVVTGALYPHYPEQYDNPVFDLALPLLGAGYTPYGLGWLLGLRGVAAMAPLALVVLAALALTAAGGDPRPRRAAAHLAAGLAIAAAFLLPLSAYGRAPRPAEAKATATVRSLWDPASGAPSGAPRSDTRPAT
ncbi:MAG TPA: hypothetical protein VKZ18_22900 [Polyangia bacterium]|nr:hypothetical protein [Polyangia bacterium]